jgi:hypothetical protein
MVDLTFPQAGDLPDAAYFASSGIGRSGIINGLTFSADFAVPEVTVAAGKAVINRGDMDTAHPNISPQETVSDALAIVEIDAQTVSLAGGVLNHIFLDANVTNDDSGTVVANTANSKPTIASVKIGEVNTSQNTVAEGWNRITDSGVLTFPDESAADEQSTKLQEGTIVYARDTNTHFFVE